MSWILNHTPPWIWVVAALAIAGTLWFYFSPIIIGVWNLTPKPVRIALAAIASLGLAIVYGRYKGSKDERDAQREREARARDTRNEINEDVNKATDDQLDRRLDRWMRPDD